VLDFKHAHERSAKNLARRNTRRAYDRIYASDDLLAEYVTDERRRFYREVADRCAALRPSRAIDVGCGTGHLLRELVDRVDGIEVCGIDHAPHGIARAGELVPTARLEVADMYSFDPGATFDLVICTEVLEHVPDPAGAMRRLVDLCAPGGHIVVSVPDGARDAFEGHVNFWAEDAFEAFVDGYGDASVERIDDGATLLSIISSRSPELTDRDEVDPTTCPA
jgi:trans-aconitate methyltransferase